METFYYPVVVVENAEELEAVTSYCDECNISFQFLDNDLNCYPAHILIYCDKDDFQFSADAI